MADLTRGEQDAGQSFEKLRVAQAERAKLAQLLAPWTLGLLI